MSENYRLLNTKWLQAFSDFIIANHTYAVGADSNICGPITEYDDVVSTLRHMTQSNSSSGYDYVSNDSWKAKVKVLAFFLHPPETMKDVFMVVAWTPGANISRCSSYDPLTYQGLCDIQNFIGNGLCDDWQLACYTGKDGDRRIIKEPLDDAVRWNAQPITAKLLGNLDKDETWLRDATRNNLDLQSFSKLFLGGLDDSSIVAPTQEELMDLWMGRAYDDFNLNSDTNRLKMRP